MHRFLLGFRILAWLVVLSVATPAHADIRLFGSRETPSTQLAPFPKWTGTLSRDPGHRQKMRSSCSGTPRTCLYDRWMSMVDRAKPLSTYDKLVRINREINASKYIIDMINWGMEDYWETPFEFFTRNGDCEDYAIAKYMTLKMLGVPTSSMRIVVLQDNNLRLLHSVLVVTDRGTNYILDNQIQQVVKDSSIHHYAPIYSINESRWWRHSR